ncbi:hypothetical protein F5884DRAFT_743687 [Xylogone sp. PMI_703]|nr:hypothetical protein F5884DRAFT_743687 [Xylogone sp. PMI_703]
MIASRFALLVTAATLAMAASHRPRPVPDIEGPITGGHHGWPFCAYYGNISDIGYIEEEYFISGEAERYHLNGEFTIDGRWTLIPDGAAKYKTRILVRRPAKEENFNGDVIIEWDNVSSGYDIMMSDGPGVYEAGYVYIGISNQVIGLIGYQNIPGETPLGLTLWDPERYGTLVVPDDRYSYDIYTQAANLVRSGKIPHVRAKHVIGVGSSQSGIQLISYANGVQPLYHAFDALLPNIAFGQAFNFSLPISQPVPGVFAPSHPARIRTDLDTPVHEICSESEALYVFSQGCRQPQTESYRYWEIAGSAHANALALSRLSGFLQRDLDMNVPVPSTADQVSWLPSLDAAYQHASTWIRTGRPPPVFPLMDIISSPSAPLGADYVRDDFGNTIGGARLPEMTVPIAANNGTLQGTTILFNDTVLNELYPTHLEYIGRVYAAAKQAEADGLILSYRTKQYIQDAQTGNIPPKKLAI